LKLGDRFRYHGSAMEVVGIGRDEYFLSEQTGRGKGRLVKKPFGLVERWWESWMEAVGGEEVR